MGFCIIHCSTKLWSTCERDFSNPQPVVYISCHQKQIITVAPEGHENLLNSLMHLVWWFRCRWKYFSIVMRGWNHAGWNIVSHIVYKYSYAHRDFCHDQSIQRQCLWFGQYVDTKRPTWTIHCAITKSRIWFTGQLTVRQTCPPYPISGQVAQLIINHPKIEAVTMSSNQNPKALFSMTSPCSAVGWAQQLYSPRLSRWVSVFKQTLQNLSIHLRLCMFCR